MRYTRAWRVLAPLMILAALAAGCSAAAGSSGGESGSTQPILIGQTAGTTGFMSVFDIPVQQGMQMAIDDINAQGGVLGRQLKLVTTNNETDVSKIQTAAQDVLDQGAEFVVTSCDFDIGGPAARVANDAGKIAMGCAGGPLYGVDGIGPLTYNFYPGSRTEGALLAEYAKEKGYTRPFVITDQSLEYPQVVGDFFEKRWADLGGTLAGKATYQNGDESAAAQIADAQRANPDVILAASYPPGGATLLRQLRAAGLTQPLLGTAAFDGTYWTGAVPGISDFTIPAAGGLTGDDPVAARNDFFTRFQQRFGQPAASANYPLEGYSMVQAIARAVDRAGSTDTTAVQAELDKFTNEDLLIGPTTFTPDCHVPSGRSMLLKTYTDGTPKVIGERTVQSLMGQAPC
ncbi:ABC transporter substrate-binding protein [Pseudonocardia aurantiaca]|uniref:ABC transporter substrate-binding protein n=1 Tax=Pseudonocardia aurantiaca TaxID=75290 RepID=A0ABW4FI78_9PSEU